MSIKHISYQREHEQSAREDGFTILELMVASAVFTVILIVIAVGVLSYTNSYYKGINSSKTQEATRAIMDTLVQSIQFGKIVKPLSGTGGVLGLCIDNTLYSYMIGQEVVDSVPGTDQGYHGLVSTTGGDCTGATPAVPATQTLLNGSRELLGQRMRLGDLEVTPGGNLYTIRVRVLYGDDDVFTPTVSGSTNWANEKCQGGPGSQFCAVSDLTTTVERRLL